MAAGRPKFYEREGTGSDDLSDLDAVGNDKRRAVIGQQYGATAKKRLIVYGAVVAVIVLVIVAFTTVIRGVDERDISLEQTAPWAQPDSQQDPPRDVDFGRNGPEDTIPPEEIFSR